MPLIEKDNFGQYINFDISVKNISTHTIDLGAIELSLTDPSQKLVLVKSINGNGQSPSIKTLGIPLLKPGETIDIFNPFHSFPPDISVAQIKYTFYFNISDTKRQKENNKKRLPNDFDMSFVKTVSPHLYNAHTKLHLPLKGKLIIWDGHDFYSHHRRFPLGLSKRNANLDTANSNRYAYDFVNIDVKGKIYSKDPFKKTDYYVFGKPIFAPAAGKVIDMLNTIPDNTFIGKTIKYPELPSGIDPYGMGNHVIIDHGNGEFSVMLHMEKGTVLVKNGDMISEGQQIGNVGFSGDAIFPHLHFTFMNGSKELNSEGIPSYFYNYKWYNGSIVYFFKCGRIDSGEIIESSDK